MSNLSAFLADRGSDEQVGSVSVMHYQASERSAFGVGSADVYFGADLQRLEVGASQGQDQQRGAYDWWPLMLDGQQVGELRDDANGMTIHVKRRVFRGNHPNRSQTARKQAQALGYFVREGSYQGTTDDRLGRWYYGHQDDDGFRPWGAGYATQREAWEAALEHDGRAA